MKGIVVYRFFIFFSLLIGTVSESAGQGNIAEISVSVDTHNKQIIQILREIQRDYGLSMSYDEQIFDSNVIYGRLFRNANLSDLLNYLLAGTKVRYTFVNRALIFYAESRPFTLKGRVIDSLSGESLIGASLLIAGKNSSTLTNNYGFYSLTLPLNTYDAVVTYLGYRPKRIRVVPEMENDYLVIKLAPQDMNLKEVVVDGDSIIGQKQQQGLSERINWARARNASFYKGEADIIKALQMQNGINGLTEGGSNLFVRGAGKDQTLMLLDEAVVYNPSHFFGLTSVFNSDILKHTQFYKDAIPANYGGRLSAIMEMSTRDGDVQTTRFFGGASLLVARLGAEGPFIRRGKGSFLVTARSSISNMFDTEYRLFQLKGTYSDYNAKLNYTINDRNKVYLSGYIGQDKVVGLNNNNNRWGNWTSTLRWNYIHSPRLFMNVSAILSNYRNKLDVSKPESSENRIWLTQIRDVSLKSDFSYYMGSERTLDFGTQATFHRFKPGEIEPVDISNEENIFRAQAYEYAGYASFNWKIDSSLRIVLGTRMNAFYSTSFGRYYLLNGNQHKVPAEDADKEKAFYGIEPRMTLMYRFGTAYNIQVSYNRLYQYLQLLQNDELAFSSLEAWVPAGQNIRPQYADAFSFRFHKRIHKGYIRVDGYWKKMHNQVELIDHAQLILNPFIETQIKQGNGRMYGVEFSLNKRAGAVDGTLCYSWSRSFRTIPGINKGREYVANVDIPHVVKSSLSYDLSSFIHVNAYYTIHSGRPLTYPMGFTEYEGIVVPIYTNRNSHRMPLFSRLDVSCSLDLETKKQREKGWRSTLNIGVYNLFDRRNPLYYSFSEDDNGTPVVQQTSFSGLVPAINYAIRF